MAYGENKMTFAVADGVTTVNQEIEYDNRCFKIETRISEKFGFVNTSIYDCATGKDVTLEMTIEKVKAPTDEEKEKYGISLDHSNLNVTLLTGDEELGTLEGE